MDLTIILQVIQHPQITSRNVTDRLKAAGEILGINVLDHIIHGDGTEEIDSLMEDVS